MKVNLFSSIVAGLCSVLILTSCVSHERKADDAFERVKESKKELKDSAKTIPALSVELEQAPAPPKSANPDETEWTMFRTETEKKITASENKIRELKEKKVILENKPKFDKQMIRLEQKNNDFRKRMNDYNQEVKVKWEKFKVGLNHDINALELELRDVKINSKELK